MDAADLLHQRGIDDFSVVFCGSAPPGQEHFQQALQARIARSPLRQRVVLKSFTSDIWPVYGALDIACAPSTEPEPFGLVAVEAMSMGKPMVVADHGGLSEIVVNGSTGFAVRPGDARALADGLHALLTDAGMRHRMGQAGTARVISCFQLDRMLDRFSLAWRQTMGQQP
jgi:glycosyltransferase involved in cell wall biosynthesis